MYVVPNEEFTRDWSDPSEYIRLILELTLSTSSSSRLINISIASKPVWRAIGDEE